MSRTIIYIYLIKSTLEDVSEGKSELLDNEDNAVIVWRDNIAAQGPKVEIRDRNDCIFSKEFPSLFYQDISVWDVSVNVWKSLSSHVDESWKQQVILDRIHICDAKQVID